MKRMEIDTSEYEEIKAAEKATKSKHISKKLRVLMLRHEGKGNREIAEAVGFSEWRIPQLLREYKETGIEEYTRSKYKGNHRSLSEEDEKAILDRFTAKAQSGQIITVKEIKQAFEEKIGKETSGGYIYSVLERHKWKKTMPRAQHPKKASEEVIEDAKKNS